VVGVDPLGMAGPAQRLQPADVRANEGLGIAADPVDGTSRPLQMPGRAIDRSLTCDIQDVAVRSARPGRGGTGHDDHASADVLGAGGIHLDVMHTPVHPVDQQPDPFAHLVGAKPFVEHAADDALGRVLSMQDVAGGMTVLRQPFAPQGPIGADKTILIDSLAIMAAIVLPTIFAIFTFAYWFRASNTKAFYWPDWEYSGRIELVVWSIPALTVILLGGVAWIGSHQLGSMIYTMNGMVTRLELRADNPGTLQGLAAHFSGDGFPEMLFDVHVVSPLAFPDWVASTARTERVLNTESYDKLARQSVEMAKPTFRLDDPRLFEAIATQKIPPAPGPRLTSESAQSHIGAPNAW
jgi:heme/copper-type cytochrome/quinol oxidase subunit 2